MPTDEQRIEDRLTEAAEMTEGLVEFFDEIAEDIIGWRDDGLSEEEIDERLYAYLAKLGITNEALLEDMPESLLALVPEEHHLDFIGAYRFIEWLVLSAKYYAEHGKAAPMYPFLAGGVLAQEFKAEEDDEPEPLVWVLATPSSDVRALTNQFHAACRGAFGKGAFKSTTRKNLEAAEFSRLHRLNFSYRWIAVQSLRRKHPDILDNEDKYEKLIIREKERVKKAVKAAKGRWKKRGLPSSPPE